MASDELGTVCDVCDGGGELSSTHCLYGHSYWVTDTCYECEGSGWSVTPEEQQEIDKNKTWKEE